VIKGKHKRVTPVWLASAWERRKKETASCVEAAIGQLCLANQPVTLSSIRNEVRLLFGRSLSTNTITRNEGAYQLYLTNRRAPSTPQVKSHLILEMYARAEPTRKAAIQARVARLRRHPKDDLIVRLMRTEESLREQMDVANRLREQIILASVEQHRNRL
jgi:hypothetical protein